ncbi:flagellar assembly protein FliW [Peribacillus sp. SCS-155]|uniref:flagellar assembly protein FliW n=1 Tax=Peribacillus sedimenti TaxID=3115297 RepID=UPI003905D980
MNVNTKFHGEQEIDKDKIIHFSSGIPGFLDEKQFYLFPIEDTPLLSLQSIKNEQVAFIITSPFAFFPDYEIVLSKEVIDLLDIQSEKDVSVFTILTVEEPFSKTTANLQAPVILNLQNNQAKQFIMSGSPYITKHQLFSSPQEQEEK